jgi:AraC family transcriptional regulator
VKNPLRQMQPVMAFAAAHLDANLSLAALARRAGLSPFHMHRLFRAAAGETPKQFAQRLRLDCAAAMLLGRRDAILDVALACGFESHEVFSRAFRRRFGMTPASYRQRGFAAAANGSQTAKQAAKHKALTRKIGPCLRLFLTNRSRSAKGNEMAYSITTTELSSQPVLVVRRRVKRPELAAALGELFGRIFQHLQRAGAALAGPPFTRYLEWGPGLITIQAGMPVAAAVSGEGDIVADTLPGGPAATTTHAGPYEGLGEAHAAVQVWIEERGLAPAGPPWESYVTDPADYPDPADWKTDIFWPVAR